MYVRMTIPFSLSVIYSHYLSSYVFGGEGVLISDSDGSVYVLSLPSFRWIRLTQDLTPRIKSKCHLLGKHTMLVVGGVVPREGAPFDPLPSDCEQGTFRKRARPFRSAESHVDDALRSRG